MTLRVAYPFTPYPGAKSQMQAVVGSDRPTYALLAAVHARGRGADLYGVLRGRTANEQKMAVYQELAVLGVDPAMVYSWVARAYTSSGLCVPSVAGMVLSPYQTRAVERLSPVGGVLAMGCGLGKTLTAAAFVKTHQYTTVLVVCPLNAVPTWKRQIAAGFLPADTMIQSVDSAHNLAGLRSAPNGCVIFDEAHMLGESTARRTRACLDLRLKFTAGLCLTGTLLHSGIIRAMTVLDLAIPGLAGFSSKYSAGEYFKCLTKKVIGNRTVTQVEKPGAAGREAFVRYLDHAGVVALTTQSAEVRATFQLPTQHIHEERIKEPWASLDDEVVRLVQEKIAAGEPGLMSAPEAAHAIAAAGLDEKIEVLRGYWGEDPDEPIVIGAQYTASLDAIQAALEQDGITFVRVDGAVTGDARGECQRKFQAGEVRVFLGQASAAAVAMDLYRARYSVMVDHPWKSADYAQFLARTARRGQTQETHHIDLIANHLQARIVQKLRDGDEFNAQAAEWQQIKKGLPCPAP